MYPHELGDAPDAERVVASWFRFYAESRPHSSLGGRTLGEVYWGALGKAA